MDLLDIHLNPVDSADSTQAINAVAVSADDEDGHDSMEGLEGQEEFGKKKRKNGEREDASLEDFIYRETDGCIEIWEKEVRKGVKAKRAKCIAPIRNDHGEEIQCGKIFARVPNCRRHVLVHQKHDGAVFHYHYKRDISAVMNPEELNAMPHSPGTVAMHNEMEDTVYFVMAWDPEQKLRRRTPPKKSLATVTDLTEYVTKEFNVLNDVRLAFFDPYINEYVYLENDRDIKNSFKFKIYNSPSYGIYSLDYKPNHSKEERELRVHLAAAYRLFDMFGWTDLIYNHITVSIPGQDAYLINPFGLLFSEITASSLVKIDLKGDILEMGCTKFGINKTGYVIHSAIHEARKDIRCVMHCHSTAGVGVSCMKEGLMSISQNAAIVGEVSYHDYEGLSVNEDEKKRIVKDLGPTSKTLILRNHGLLTAGDNIAEAFFRMYNLNRTCEMQIAALSGGLENVRFPEQRFQEFTNKEAAGFNPEGVGQKEFAALLRKLDALHSNHHI